MREWMEEIGEEGAINRELEIRLGSRSMGPLVLNERGPGMIALADVLGKYLAKYPESVILEKWVSDMTEYAELAIKSADIQVGFTALDCADGLMHSAFSYQLPVLPAEGSTSPKDPPTTDKSKVSKCKAKCK
jgi:hypothetical protein